MGKTATTTGVAVALATRGRRVLVVDTDAQANATRLLGIDSEDTRVSLADVLRDRTPLADAVHETPFAGVSVVPANRKRELKAVEQSLWLRNRPLEALQYALAQAPLEALFDYCLFDCGPGGDRVGKNAMRAADHVVIVTELDALSIQGMDALAADIHELQEDHPSEAICQLVGVIIAQFDARKQIQNRENLATLLSVFGETEALMRKGDILIFRDRIRTDEQVRHAQKVGQTVFSTNRRSRARSDFMAVAQELEARLSQ